MSHLLLIVDSDRPELKKLREIFSREGYSVMTATEEYTAAVINSSLGIDLVIAEPKYFNFRKASENSNQKQNG